jgi:hypothetical protein
MEFQEWPKTSRLYAESGVTITEKIDGTFGVVVIEERPFGSYVQYTRLFRDDVAFSRAYGVSLPEWTNTEVGRVLTVVNGPEKFDLRYPTVEYWVGAQSRNRMITDKNDNFGFGAWVKENAQSLINELGEGRHVGEWWGRGVGRGYGLNEKRFSLFNTRKWSGVEFTTPGLGVVPVLWEGIFDSEMIARSVEAISARGSFAAPGFARPEGICIYHRGSDTIFKYTLDGDGHKGAAWTS